MGKIRILHILGIDDTDKVGVVFLSPDPYRLRHRYTGNVEVASLIDPDEFEVVQVICGGVASEPVTVGEIHVVLNAVCDPDTNKKTLAIVSRVQEQFGMPVINNPDRVLGTARDAVPGALAGQPGLRVPNTARIQPMYRADVPAMAEAAGIGMPCLVREAGTHGGLNLTLLDKGTPLDELDKFRFDGRDFYVTEFVDFRSPDGLYRKYRVLVIGGVPIARHMIALENWNIHAEDRPALMEVSPDLQHEEERFLRRFSPDRFPVFQVLAAKLGLDYFGVDFAIDELGNVIVFETNCCFRAIVDEASVSKIPYHHELIANVKAALADLIRARAAQASVARAQAAFTPSL